MQNTLFLKLLFSATKPAAWLVIKFVVTFLMCLPLISKRHFQGSLFDWEILVEAVLYVE